MKVVNNRYSDGHSIKNRFLPGKSKSKGTTAAIMKSDNDKSNAETTANANAAKATADATPSNSPSTSPK